MARAAASTFSRAGVIFSGLPPVATKPKRGAAGALANGARRHMRSTMPRGLRVQRATQSTKSRRFFGRRGTSTSAATVFRRGRLSPLSPQTTPTVGRGPSATSTTSPTARSRSPIA